MASQRSSRNSQGEISLPPGPYRTPFASHRPTEDDDNDFFTRMPQSSYDLPPPSHASPSRPQTFSQGGVDVPRDVNWDGRVKLNIERQKEPSRPETPKDQSLEVLPTPPSSARSNEEDPLARPPLVTKWAPLATLLFFAYLAAMGYYFYIRILYTLDMGYQRWYGIYILAVEFLGMTSVVPYGLLLTLYTVPRKKMGLPADDQRRAPVANFHVRVLVPCYKESMATIMATVGAALQADLPAGCERTVYLCDDGNNPEKAAFIKKLGPQAVYVTGRNRQPGEINGKSANLNNCLKHIIYRKYKKAQEIPKSEVIVVFDADMVARKNFFLKVLHVMCDDTTALCLTPQAFSNINPSIDIFNNINLQFWEYILPGCDALGYIACTGTNFCVRARALGSVGWFPEYTITEDYALSMELKRAGFKGRYLLEYLAVGEAPDEIRNVFRQRSRWTKGHMQVFFSRRCPLFQWKLPFLMKVLYTYGTWSYFATIITTYTFLLVPFISLVFGWHPVSFNRKFAFAATLYLGATFLLMSYVRKLSHLKSLWLAQVSNYILCFTYFKAVLNTLLALIGFKEKAGFKATDKKGPVAALMKMMSRVPSARVNGDAPAPPPGPAPEANKTASDNEPESGGCCCPNMGDLQGVLDPMVLFLCLAVCLTSIGAGIYKMVDAVRLEDLLEFLRTGRLGVYTILPILWSAYSAIPPLLFFMYCWSKGPAMEKGSLVLHMISTLVSVGAVASLWFTVPATYDFKEVLPLTTTFYDIQKSGSIAPSVKAQLPWLQESGWSDPVVGGYYMGADYVKYTFPMSYVVAMTGWSMIQFKEGYQKAGQMDAMVRNLKHGADYLMKAHVQDEELVAQVGDPVDYIIDPLGSGFWGMPDKMPDNRITRSIKPSSLGGSDLAASTAAALAVTSIFFRDRDREYAREALHRAERLYTLATKIRPVSSSYCSSVACQGITDVGSGGLVEWSAFPSSSVYDDLAWAAIWLYKATNTTDYADDSEFYIRQHWRGEYDAMGKQKFIPSYDNVGWAAQVLMANDLQNKIYADNVQRFLRLWVNGNLNNQGSIARYTVKGLAWTPTTPLPNVAAVSLLGLMSASLPNVGMDKHLSLQVRCWANEQMHYILGGQYGSDLSYLVGYGKAYPKQPQHRQASCSAEFAECNVRNAYIPFRPNPRVLVGALVAGPNEKDQFVDLRTNDATRVGLQWNAPLTGTLAGLLSHSLSTVECQAVTSFFNQMVDRT